MLGARAGLFTDELNTIPDRSLDFVSASSMYLSLATATLGYNTAKWSFSCWLEPDGTGVARPILVDEAGSANTGFLLLITSANVLLFYTYDGTALDGQLICTQANHGITTSWAHLLVHFDQANATSGDRMRFWVNGSEITTFSTDVAPSNPISQGSEMRYGRNGSSYYDGRLFQPVFYDNYLVPVAKVYDSGVAFVPPANMASGLITSSFASKALTDDLILSTDWTNNNTVTKSSDIPA